jgi:hypothetical protein
VSRNSARIRRSEAFIPSFQFFGLKVATKVRGVKSEKGLNQSYLYGTLGNIKGIRASA